MAGRHPASFGDFLSSGTCPCRNADPVIRVTQRQCPGGTPGFAELLARVHSAAEAGPETVKIIRCGHPDKPVAAAAERDPCGAWVDVLDLPLAAEIRDNCGERGGVVAVFEQFPEGGYGRGGEDE